MSAVRDPVSMRQLEETYTLPVYQNIRLPLTIVRGKGNFVYDEAGTEYLDLYGGHAVCSIGHSHPVWVEAMQRQIETLTFYSNAVYNPVRAEAAQLLVETQLSIDGLGVLLQFGCRGQRDGDEDRAQGYGAKHDRRDAWGLSWSDHRCTERHRFSSDARTLS